MRIAFFSDSYKPYLSGVTSTVETLANALRTIGHRVYILAPRYPGHADTDPDVTRFPSFAGGYPKFRLAVPFVRCLPEVDIIHSHSPFQAGLLARFIARRRKIPFVYSFHTLFTKYVHYARFVPRALAKLGIVAYLRFFCRGADIIVVPTEMTRRVLSAWKIRRPVKIIPSGIDLRHCPADPHTIKLKLREKYRLPPDSKVLFYAGRLSKEKNIPFLIKAFEKLARKGVYLVLAGGGPLEKELRGLPAAGKKIVLTGEVRHPEILAYYSMGDIFVFSSLTETQGLVLAEAKAAGLPVVALFAGGLAGSVRAGIDGYLTKRTLDDFVEHVGRLLDDDKLREKMSRAASEDARARFSSPAVAKQFETVYNSLISGQRGRI